MRHLVMTYAIHPFTRSLVGSILTEAGIDPRDQRGTLEAIHDYVTQLRYVPDPAGLELVNEPRWTLWAGVGDCDDLAVLEGCLVAAAGLPWSFGLSARDPGRGPDHVYLVVELDDGPIIADPTRQGPVGDTSEAAARWIVRTDHGR